MQKLILPLLFAGILVAVSTIEASAVVCARGVYRAGCVGPRGAVAVRRPVVVAPGAVVVRRPVVVAPRAVVVRRPMVVGPRMVVRRRVY